MPEAALPAISELLAKWGSGDREAFQALIPLLYDELHSVAHRYLRKARRGHTLQTTALVHAAYLCLRSTTMLGFRTKLTSSRSVRC